MALYCKKAAGSDSRGEREVKSTSVKTSAFGAGSSQLLRKVLDCQADLWEHDGRLQPYGMNVEGYRGDICQNGNQLAAGKLVADQPGRQPGETTAIDCSLCNYVEIVEA